MGLTREQLKKFIIQEEFTEIFLDSALGWDEAPKAPFNIDINFAQEDYHFNIKYVAQKRGFIVCWTKCDKMPTKAVRQKLERELSKIHYEHILILTAKDGEQKWMISHKLDDKPIRLLETGFAAEQTPEAIIQKLNGLVFSMSEEDALGITDVSVRAVDAFTMNAEDVTKRFYERFSRELKQFQIFIKGLEDKIADEKQYAALMLNRLMFIYFIQKKNFLDSDVNYLKNRLLYSKKELGKDKFYQGFYRHFLINLFHHGLGAPIESRTNEIKKLIGKVPYLNGGLFDQHALEKEYGAEIKIADDAFDKLFKFFDEYNWHLDNRPIASGKDINPDVIGYIFEKYINDRAKMGAYYTQEDITGYIARNTILPYLLQQAKRQCAEAFDKENGTIWNLLKNSPEKYIYDDAQFGCNIDDNKIPLEIISGGGGGGNAAASDLSTKRKKWNTSADEKFALPTETWRETIARRQRFFSLKNKLKNGEITDIADLITYNLDIEKLTFDTLQEHEGRDFIIAFYSAIAGRQKQEGENVKSLRGISILDPACGSGAFLFAALNVLEPLYTVCINRMREFVEEDNIISKNKNRKPVKHLFFRSVLGEMKKHNNEQYWIYRNIILGNLFGVDFMPEAAEVAKLRLFLKLAAAAEMDATKDNMGLEPLPDIDFNIRAGNSLVGFFSMEDFTQQNAKILQLISHVNMIKSQAASVGGAYRHFVNAQSGGVISDIGSKQFKEAKTELQDKLKKLNLLLDQYLGNFYGCSQEIGEKQLNKKFIKWQQSHKPFHWATEFYEIMKEGGFDVVIGNPPYLEMRQVSYEILGYKTRQSNALHAVFMERSHSLLNESSTMGAIVPMALTSTQRMKSVQEILESRHGVWYSNFSWRPGKLFETVNRALSIFICHSEKSSVDTVFSTRYIKWTSESRGNIFSTLYYLQLMQKRTAHWVPKINEYIEQSILSKLAGSDSIIGQFVGKTSNNIYHRHTGGLYWKLFTDEPPYFYENGILSVSKTQTCFSVQEKYMVMPLIAILSSDVFWYHYTISSNLRDLPPYDINHFPIHYKSLYDNDLENLGMRYLNDIKNNSTILIRKQKTTGETKTQQFNIIKSKSIINEIDKVLAKHYGFSDEELDYIINYDYKYRMGGAEE